MHGELDSAVPDRASYKSVAHHALVGNDDRSIVVGVRATGKNGLVYQLGKEWANEPNTRVIHPSLQGFAQGPVNSSGGLAKLEFPGGLPPG